jgi:hypothetical protein
MKKTNLTKVNTSRFDQEVLTELALQEKIQLAIESKSFCESATKMAPGLGKNFGFEELRSAIANEIPRYENNFQSHYGIRNYYSG